MKESKEERIEAFIQWLETFDLEHWHKWIEFQIDPRISYEDFKQILKEKLEKLIE